MLAELVPDIKKTAELVEEISAACREQDVGVDADQSGDPATRQGDAAERCGIRADLVDSGGTLASQAEQLQAGIAFFVPETCAAESRNRTPRLLSFRTRASGAVLFPRIGRREWMRGFSRRRQDAASVQARRTAMRTGSDLI